jgi:hypothetical protein
MKIETNSLKNHKIITKPNKTKGNVEFKKPKDKKQIVIVAIKAKC